MSNPNQLTDRQSRVLDLMCEGLSNKEIARAMGISPRTVEIHRGYALRCIGARNTIHGVLLWDRARRGSMAEDIDMAGDEPVAMIVANSPDAEAVFARLAAQQGMPAKAVLS